MPSHKSFGEGGYTHSEHTLAMPEGATRNADNVKLPPTGSERPASPSLSRLTMKYVYLIRSVSAPDQRYVGVMSNLEERLRTHNGGGSPHTSKYTPWELVTYVCFTDDQRAIEFERYLKSGSGHAFAKKRLW